MLRNNLFLHTKLIQNPYSLPTETKISVFLKNRVILFSISMAVHEALGPPFQQFYFGNL